MTSIEYFKSEWIPLRVGAATFIGYALGNVPEDKKFSVGLNPGIISSGKTPLSPPFEPAYSQTLTFSPALIGLLKQKSPQVRAAGAAAMSHLHSY